MTKSVIETPSHLDVKIRVAQGLSKEGGNLLKNLLLEITVLSIGFLSGCVAGDTTIQVTPDTVMKLNLTFLHLESEVAKYALFEIFSACDIYLASAWSKLW